MNAKPPKQCVTTCVVCENYFEYAARSRGRTFYFREVCDDCQMILPGEMAQSSLQSRCETLRAIRIHIEDGRPVMWG